MNIITILSNVFDTIIARRDKTNIIYTLKDYKLNERYANVKLTLVVENIKNNLIYWRYLKNPYDPKSLSDLKINNLFGLETAVIENINYLSFDNSYLKEMIDYKYDEKIEYIRESNKIADDVLYDNYVKKRYHELKENVTLFYNSIPITVAAGGGTNKKSKRRGIGYDAIGDVSIGL